MPAASAPVAARTATIMTVMTFETSAERRLLSLTPITMSRSEISRRRRAHIVKNASPE